MQTLEDLKSIGFLLQAFTQQSLEFQEKIMERSGLGDETYLPAGKSVVCVSF